MILTDDDFFELASTVWSSTLGLELERADVVDGKIGDTTLTACVQVTGDWEGAITVRCSTSLAAKLASVMFDLAPEELGEEEVRDAMGEIVNMTGGNVKGMAPGTNTLALPTVTEGGESALSIAKTERLNEVVGYSDGEPIVFTVLGRLA
jgi:chemotaxis protein CheX